MDRFETQMGIARNNAGEWYPCPVKQAEETMTVTGTVRMVGEEWEVKLETDLSRFADYEAQDIRNRFQDGGA